MQENNKTVLVYTTFPSLEAAESEGAALVDAGLAACVNILPAMVSIYRWKGERQRDCEAIMLVKTRRDLAEKVVDAVAARHSYETPAILVLPVEGGSAPYLGWILAETAPRAPGSE